MTGPAVAVVVPTHDRAALLVPALQSILDQRDVALEVIVVDDGSGPRDAAAVRSLAGGSVRVLRNEVAGGVGAARNRGAAAARAPWVSFCDDDDLWVPTKLARQLDAASSTERCWAYTGAVKFEAGPVVWQVMEPPTPAEVHARLPSKNVIPAGASNVLVDREVFLTVGGFDPALAHLADWDLWLKLRETGLPAAAAGIGVCYRMHTGAMSLNPNGILEDLATIDVRWRHARGGEALDPGPTHLWIAMSWLRAGRRLPAALSYLRAARSRPRRGLRGLLRTAYPRPPMPPRAQRSSRAGDGRQRGGPADLPDEVRHLLAELAAAGASPPAARP
ncbi:glycosyltransferase family 2 protein [Nitriliruptor alkaliphilus]|uniref:glycosyltransferase family 2 protein n=1 Tax=Nitriliruptor alkaliphilus TaxID=427918 RepID=UPI00069824F8|nr:glycosyltransferase family A protein [Nitriliruptor alkaliphilus]